MQRRALLSLFGSSLAGAAGCLSTSADDTAALTDQSPTATALPTSASTPASVTHDALQPVVLHLATDAIYVSSDEGQYLFLTVEMTRDQLPQKDNFSFRFDGETFSPFDGGARKVYRAYGDDGYDATAGGGWLLFVLPPTGSAAEARLSWPGGEWRPDAALRRRLEATDPPLSLSTSFPETVSAGEAPSISLTVTNKGDLPGRFVAGMNRSGPRTAYKPVEHVSILVPAGETVTYEVTDDELEPMDAANVGDGESDLTYQLDWAEGELRREVRLTE